MVRSLRGIEAMVNLRRLWVDNNAVADISPLLALRYLQLASLRGNPLSSDSAFSHAAALRARGVEVLLDAATLARLPDPALRAVVERTLGKGPGSPLTEGDLLTLRSLNASSSGVSSLRGLDAAARLESLTLSGNAPPSGSRGLDIRALSGLRSVTRLDLSDNALTDIRALSGLTGLRTLRLGGNVAFAAAAYARHADGFLTSLHETAPAADGAARVAVFNPASNTAQRSLLRLANNGAEPAQAAITGLDDAGTEAGPVVVTVPPGEALTLTAIQLERGGEGLSGALGDGAGKWRLTVSFDNPLVAMSLMESPAGHLANLSATTRP